MIKDEAMRKIVLFNRVSIDGYYADRNNNGIGWFVHDHNVDKAAHELMQPDTILFGRVTYQMFENHWPLVAVDLDAPEQMRQNAEELNAMTKVVFSNTLKSVEWQNSILEKREPAEVAASLRAEEGGDIVIFGSGSIAQQLARAGLIDDYLIVVTPVVLDGGSALFSSTGELELELIEARSFASGNVLLHYKR